MSQLASALHRAGTPGGQLEVAPFVPEVPGADAEEGGASAGLSVAFFAQLGQTLAGISSHLERQAAAARHEWKKIHPAPLAAIASAAAGSLIDERWGPREGWLWQVILLSVTGGAGFTNGVLYTTGNAAGQVAANFVRDFIPDANQMATWEPRGLFLMPGQFLSWASAGGGMTATGAVVEVALDKVPAYLL